MRGNELTGREFLIDDPIHRDGTDAWRPGVSTRKPRRRRLPLYSTWGALFLLLLSPQTSRAWTQDIRQFVLPSTGPGVANAVVELRDGGLVAVGYADIGGTNGTDVLMVRFNAAGDTLWTRFYGGVAGDFGWDVVESPDGGFFIVGFTEAPTVEHEDVLVLRIDAAGSIVWRRAFGEPGRDRAWSTVLSGDGGIVVAAETEDVERGGRDAFLICVNGDGEPSWSRAIREAGDQRVFQVARTIDGDFVAVGTSAADEGSPRDLHAVRIDPGGSTVWTRTYGGVADDVGHGVTPLGDGEVLLTGYGESRTNGSNDIYLIRLDRDGDIRWWRHHGGIEDDRAMMSAPLAEGGFVTVGYSLLARGLDAVILESDSAGELRRRVVLEHVGNDRGVMIRELNDGGYVLAGTVGGLPNAGGDFAVIWLAGREWR